MGGIKKKLFHFQKTIFCMLQVEFILLLLPAADVSFSQENCKHDEFLKSWQNSASGQFQVCLWMFKLLEILLFWEWNLIFN